VAGEESTKSAKRRLRAPEETVRQRQTNLASQADIPRKRRLGFVGRALKWPFRKIAGWSLWQAKWFKPFRFVGRWVGLVLWPPYFRNSVGELKLVTWPNFTKSWRLTFAVLSFAAVFGLAIAGVDYGLDRLFKDVLLK
jgi:preprotein translocase SecE subunit